MSKAARNLLEGVVTAGVGLVLWLSTEDVEIPVFTLTKVGVVMMWVGGALVVTGLYQAVRTSAGGR